MKLSMEERTGGASLLAGVKLSMGAQRVGGASLCSNMRCYLGKFTFVQVSFVGLFTGNLGY
jgi:hypothetical protein